MLTGHYLRQETLLRQKIILIIFGLLLFLTLLEIGLRLGGFMLLSLQEYRNLQSIKQKGAYRIMCLGESTTAGQYPHFLEETLNRSSIGIKFSVIDKGTPAMDTSFIAAHLKENLEEYKPDMVIAMMGINDGGPHLPRKYITGSKTKLFFESLRVYDLAMFLRLHMITKLKATNVNVCAVKESVAKQSPYVSDMDLRTYMPKPTLFSDSDDNSHVALGKICHSRGEFVQAELEFKKALALNPQNDDAYANLIWMYKRQGKVYQSEETFKEAIAVNPQNFEAYFYMALTYRDRREYYLAEKLLMKAIELCPRCENVYIELSWVFRQQKKYSQAEALLKKGIELIPSSDNLYAALSIFYKENGKDKLSALYAKNADQLRIQYYIPETMRSYIILKKILDEKGIQFMCMQYPVRSIEPLRKIFEREGGVVFVDNERTFKDGIKKDGYKAYFTDIFGGDFGHCTDKGNRLLAENIANTILKDYFKIDSQ